MPTRSTQLVTQTGIGEAYRIVAAGDGNTLINNAGPGIMYIGDDVDIIWNDPVKVTPIGVGGFVTVDGVEDLFATVQPGATNVCTVNIIRGGLNFFQPPSVISGAELLLYTLPAAEGNLFFAASPMATSDPFGDVIPQGFNIGKWSAAGALQQHFGVDTSGRVYIAGPDGVTRIQINNGTGGVGPDVRFFNDFGAVILCIDPSAGGTFTYQDTGSATQGVLIGAQASKNFTDPIDGTTGSAGVDLIDPVFGDTITVLGANISFGQVAFTTKANVTANAGSGATNPFWGVTAPEQGHVGHSVLRVMGTSADGTVGPGVIISNTDPPVRALNNLLELQGSLGMLGVTAPPTPPAGNGTAFVDGSGLLRYLSGLAGDTNLYYVPHLIATASATPQTISSTSATAITGCALPVGIGKYAFRARITYDGGTAAGTAQFGFSGPARTGQQWINALFLNNSGTGFSDAQNAAITFVTSPTLDTNPRDVVDIEGEATFTAAGTLTLTAAEGTANDTVIIQRAHMWLYPLY